jgi:serine/threonine protein kinase
MDDLEATRTAFGIARGLAVAHTRGIVHRDLKPDNILLSSEGVPKITDFGIAKALDMVGMTRAGTVMGTPAYMSPEQAEGREVDPRADVYSFGCLVQAHHWSYGVPWRHRYPDAPAPQRFTPKAS